jgi:hypothetical protein
MATPSRTRPGQGWIVFAGIMLIVAGAIDFFNGIWALDAGNQAEAVFDAWLWDSNLDAWGVIYIILGLVLIAVGVGIFQRAPWAIATGVIVAIVGAVIHAFWIFTYPIASLVLVLLNVLVIYGLVVYGADEGERAI